MWTSMCPWCFGTSTKDSLGYPKCTHRQHGWSVHPTLLDAIVINGGPDARPDFIPPMFAWQACVFIEQACSHMTFAHASVVC